MVIQTTITGGTNFGDGTRTGYVYNPSNGFRGAFNSPFQMYRITPLTLDADAIAASQTPANNTYITLTANSPSSTSTTGFWPGVGIVSMLQLDVPRALSVTVTIATTTPTNVTIWGLDYLGATMSETIPVGTNVAPQTVNGKKAFYKVYRAYSTANPGNPMTLGTTDIFGLPYYVNNFGDIPGAVWNSIALVSSALVAGVTTTPSATTGDVRGTIAVASASDGTKILCVPVYVAGATINQTYNTNLGQTQTYNTMFGATQFVAAFS